MKQLRYLLPLALVVAAVVAFQARPSDTRAQPPGPTESAAADLRVTLVSMLTEHAALAIGGLQKAYDGAPDFEAGAAQLDENTLMLTGEIRAIYGEQAAAAFLPLWRSHIGFLVDYAVGTRAGDEAKRAQAQADLDGYEDAISRLLSDANPNLPYATLRASFDEHVALLSGTIDAYAAGDYPAVYRLAGEAHEHMIMAATALAGGIARQFPQRFPGDPNTPAVDYRVKLVGLLTKHGITSGVGIQKSHDRAPDFPAAAEAARMNTLVLTDEIRQLYGEAAATRFYELWDAHVNAFAAYSAALVTGDAATIEQAKATIEAYRQGIPTLLAESNPNLSRDEQVRQFTIHLTALFGIADTYDAADYRETYRWVNRGHMHATMHASQLAAAIVAQFPERFGLVASEQTGPARQQSSGDGGHGR